MPSNISKSYKWTKEQLAIISAIIHKEAPVIIVEAVAGAAKSSTIVEAIKRAYALNNELHAEYTVFGSANAAEARLEFGHSCLASTVHAKAYKAIVKPYKLKLPIAGFLTWRDIPKNFNIPYGILSDVLQHVDKFCASRHLDVSAYNAHLDTKLVPFMLATMDKVLEGMADGQIRCTHSFYLKLYHILVMNGTITLPELDILIADEAGDMTQISLDIFNETPAKLKVIIGDSCQSVFGFMSLVSAFDYYRDTGLHLSLSKSFRVNTYDAKLVQAFCRDTFIPDMEFNGMDYTDTTIRTSAYITRTNSALIAKMVELDGKRIPFKLSSKTKVAQLFLWPLALIYLAPGKTQYNQELKHLQADADKWGSTAALREQYSLRQYVLQHNEHNKNIQSANSLLMQYPSDQVILAYNAAASHISANANLTLMTAHTSKGLTIDSVTLADDINTAVQQVLDIPAEEREQEDIETLKLYYIACTRHRLKLHNAVHLDKYREQ